MKQDGEHAKYGYFYAKIGEGWLKVDEKEKGLIEGWVSIFNVIDKARDAVIPGAFAKSIADDNHRTLVYMHDIIDPLMILGDAWLEEKDKGLYAKCKLDFDLPHSEKIESVYENARKGRIDRFSYRYDINTGGWGKLDGKECYMLMELHITEVSAVLKEQACNPEALMTRVKSMPLPDDYILEWAKSRFGDPVFTDWLYKELKGKKNTGELDEMQRIDLKTAADELNNKLRNLIGG